MDSSIDKNTFCKFANLPGIVGERFFALASNKYERISRETFLVLLFQVFSHNLDDRLKFVFQLIDFNSDGAISAHDIKMMLSFIPYSSENYEDVDMVEESSSQHI